jgi:hypothetical protein
MFVVLHSRMTAVTIASKAFAASSADWSLAHDGGCWPKWTRNCLWRSGSRPLISAAAASTETGSASPKLRFMDSVAVLTLLARTLPELSSSPEMGTSLISESPLRDAMLSALSLV